jgi:hypothetical protein
MGEANPDILMMAVANLEGDVAEQRDVLTRLEARPIPDMEGLARRVEEIADAVHTLGVVVTQRQRHRPWWWTPALCMAIAVLVAIGILEALTWGPVRTALCPPVAQSLNPPIQKGKK